MIDIKFLKKSYSNFILQIENLKIEDRVTLILGNNGAGKTTLLRSILNLIKVDSSDIYINNISNDIDDWKKYIAAYIDEDFLIQYLTPKEMLLFFITAYNINKDIVLNNLISYKTFTGDLFITNNRIKSLSKGNKQKVGLIISLLCAEKLVIWDEPLAHLDPTSQIQLIDIINNTNNKHFVISNHNTVFIDNYGDKLIIISNGTIVKEISHIEYSKWGEIINKYFNI